MFNIAEIMDYIKNESRVFIQTHNFPDHDAVASAYGLKKLLSIHGIESKLIYEGELQRDSLKKMISNLNIEIKHFEEYNLVEADKIIIVDGCKGNSNVHNMIGTEIGVIDHHEVKAPEEVRYVDIRPEYGACSTIIYSYYEQLGITVPQDVATALLIGLNVDTAQLTRGVSKEDIEAYASLYVNSNITLVNSVLRNYIQTKDLKFYKFLLDNITIKKGMAFCYFKQGCNQNLLGILGDFILSLQEVDFVVLCARNSSVINFSIRNENEKLSAGAIIEEALSGIGFGGGHTDMSGGVIKDASKFDEKLIFEKFYSLVCGE